MANATKPRLQVEYESEVLPALVKRFSYQSVMQAPKMTKIVVNMGVGDAIQDSKNLDAAVEDLKTITGQRPAVRKAKKSISNFKLRENQAIGAAVTLRGARMYEFYDRLVNVAVPRIRDFRGLPDKSFDGRGNYSIGLTEQIIFPEINYDKVNKIRGMNVTIVTSASTDEEGQRAPPADEDAVPPLALEQTSQGQKGQQRGLKWPRSHGSRSASGHRSSRCAPTPAAGAAAGRAPSCGSSACAGSASASFRCAVRCRAWSRPAGRRM